MSKMMNATVNSYLSNETPTKKAIARIKIANKLIEILEDRIPRNLREIEAIILENMNEDYLESTSVKSILEWFEQTQLITTEIRKEEFIEKDDYVWVYYDKNKNEVPSHVKATLEDGTIAYVSNPNAHSCRSEKRKIKVQVKRKYYTWVA